MKLPLKHMGHGAVRDANDDLIADFYTIDMPLSQAEPNAEAYVALVNGTFAALEVQTQLLADCKAQLDVARGVTANSGSMVYAVKTSIMDRSAKEPQ